MPDAPLSASFDADSGVLTVTGDVDEATGVELRDAIDQATAGFTRDLVVDLSGVDYFPSLAVGVLATSIRRATEADTAIELVASEGSIAQRVLVVCAMPHRLV